MLEAKCHCGDVTIAIPRRPRVLTACNCSLCRRVQPLFAYYSGASLILRHRSSALDSYVWGKGVLRWFRCAMCGCFTHHCPEGDEIDKKLRWGVNLRQVADAGLIDGVKVKLRDGAADTWKVISTYQVGESYR